MRTPRPPLAPQPPDHLRYGLALPQYDYSLPGGKIDWPAVKEWAQRAESLGFSSVWLSDHLFLDVSKYGGPSDRHAAMESLTTIAALIGQTSQIRLGAMVLCNDLRSPALVAKIVSTLAVLSGGRVEVGLGAGWYEPEYQEASIPFDPPGVRVSRLEEAVQVVRGMLSNDTWSFDGRHYRVDGAANAPRAEPPPAVWVGGKGDRIVKIAGRYADGYNAVWSWTPEEFASRVALLEESAADAGRDPKRVARSVGLYCLPGEDPASLERRWLTYGRASPSGTVPSDREAWQKGKLVGTPAEMTQTVKRFAALGVEEVILGFGVLPFQIADEEAVEYFAEAMIAGEKGEAR